DLDSGQPGDIFSPTWRQKELAMYSRGKVHPSARPSPTGLLPQPVGSNAVSPVRQPGAPPSLESPASNPRSLSVSDVIQLQRQAGNQAVGQLIGPAGRVAASPAQPSASTLSPVPAGSRPVLQRYRDFGRARGTPQYDYKIVNGQDQRFGVYHIKFHNFENLGVYNEIHIVFERYNRRGYFFYTDQGDIIEDKSSGLRLNNAQLTDRARELTLAQLSTSPTVPDNDVEESRERRREERERAQKQGEAFQKEAEEKAAKERASSLEASAKALAQEDETAKNLHDKNLLRPILETQTFALFKRFTVKDPIGKWPPPLQNLSGPILEVVQGIELDRLVSNAHSLDGLQRGYLIQIMVTNKGKEHVDLPENIFTEGENPVLSYDKQHNEYDIFYDAQED
ncbi:MAG TPA: hypothetical protein VFZ25_04285, partial [Chloroflexota bacterium]|nr:hypothetical protein [Chloroflexota bacterium]